VYTGRFSLMGASGAVVGMDFSGVVSMASEKRSGVDSVLYLLDLLCTSMGNLFMGVVGGVDILM